MESEPFAEKYNNIMVVGETGSGKSCLISEFLKLPDVANSGIGAPVTQKMTSIRKKSENVTFWDTRGYEFDGNYTDTANAITTSLKRFGDAKMVKNQMHLIWYVIRYQQTDVQADIELVKQLQNEYQIPVIIVLTQAFNDLDHAPGYNELKKQLTNTSVIAVLAKEMKVYTWTLQPSGLTKLRNLTYDKLKQSRSQVGFKSLMNWRNVARFLAIAAIAVLAAGSTGVAFIPFLPGGVDLVIGTGIDAGLLATISGIYRIKPDMKLITELVQGFLGISGAASFGKCAAKGAAKTAAKTAAYTTRALATLSWIPLVGDIIAAISGATTSISTGVTFMLSIEAVIDDLLKEQERAQWPPYNIGELIMAKFMSKVNEITAEKDVDSSK